MDHLDDESKGFITRGLSIEESYINKSENDSSFIGDCSTALLHSKLEEEGNEERTFYQSIFEARGPLHLLVLCTSFALAIGATVGVVPAVMADRYARLYHGYNDSKSCIEYPYQYKPKSCVQGFDDAQKANTIASFISNSLTFLTSSLIGSCSDEYGRRGLLIISQATAIFPSLFLVLTQLDTKLNPRFYYISSGLSGFISWIAIALVRLLLILRIFVVVVVSFMLTHNISRLYPM